MRPLALVFCAVFLSVLGPWLIGGTSQPAQAQDVLALPKASKATPDKALPNLFLPGTKAVSAPPAESEAPALPSGRLKIMPGLFEPLAATGASAPGDDGELDAALKGFIDPARAGLDYAERAQPLLDFLSKHPASPWAMALQTNLGMGYYNAGYFSRALTAWQAAWAIGKTGAQTLESKRLTDRAVGELARMHARLGHAQELEALFAQVGDRKIAGAAAQYILGAQEGLSMFQHKPEISYLCGPFALKNVLRTLKADKPKLKMMDDARSGAHGFSLTQVSALAGEAGLGHKLIYRQPGGAIPVPSVINWKLHHYAAIIEAKDGGFVIQDPTFDHATHRLTKEAIDAEGSGYFLVPDGAQAIQPAAVEGQAAPQPWRDVVAGSDEANAVYGMGTPSGWNSSATTPSDPKLCATSNALAGSSPEGMKGPSSGQMCTANAHTTQVSLNIVDPPVGYAASKGPGVEVRLTYNQREATQPANIPFSNVGQNWLLDQQSYVVDNDFSGASGVTRYNAGGGMTDYFGSPSPIPDGRAGYYRDYWTASRLYRAPYIGTLDHYELVNDDGSKLVYAQSDGATSGPRRIFLSQIVDAQGNALTLNYTNVTGTVGGISCAPSCVRLDSMTDAAGKVTSFSYTHSTNPLLVTKVTDPFGRYTTLTYDGSQRLSSITDPAGIVSSFHYDGNSVIDTLYTPYGTSSFSYGNSTDLMQRWLTLTDPLGYSTRIENYSLALSGMSDTEPASTIPSGMDTWADLNIRNTFVWNKHVVATYGTSDYTKAVIFHWTHYGYDNTVVKGFESIKRPLENRVYFNFEDQGFAADSGSYGTPTVIGRKLDNGTSQLFKETHTTFQPYLTTGALLDRTDPLNRKTVFEYGDDNLDVTAVKQQISATPTYATLAQYSYDANHNLTQYTDAGGKVWKFAYNAWKQLIYATNPLSQTIFWEYDGSARLTRVTVPYAVAFASVVYGITNLSAATAKSYNYTAACSGVTAPANTNLPISVTDSEGRVVCYQYDALDRVTKVKYPDSSTDQYDYNFPTGWTANGTSYAGTPSLDVWKHTDRLGRVTNYTYDRNRRLTAVNEPVTVGATATTRTTSYAYYEDVTLKEITDGNGNVTHWAIDLQSRPTSKTYAYGTGSAKTESYAYETTTSRLKSITDALGQIKTYSYNADNTVASIAYSNVVNATPGVSFSYDTWYPRPTGMTDQFGSTSWTYKAVGSAGALQLAAEDGPFANDTVAYGYDNAGRINSLTVDSATAESFGYDTIGRVNSHGNILGTFSYGYNGNSGQVASRSLTIGSVTTSTSWAYDTNANDRRLLTITNSGVARNFTLTSNAYRITGITDTATATHPWSTQSHSYTYDDSERLLTASATTPGNSTYQYDKLDNATLVTNPGSSTVNPTYNAHNQLATWGGLTYTYDANGNTLSGDGTRTYKWDAEDRLIEVDTVGSSDKTVFGYDGLGRRVTQADTVSGTTTTTRYAWCGARICQQRNSSNTITARYFPEGEYIVSGTKKYVYQTDQLGSVRDVIDATTGTRVAAIDYGPYGNRARTNGSVTPGYQYAGLFYHPRSGLMLSATRALDVGTGRWLSRDTIHQAAGPNEYAYTSGNVTNRIDPSGRIGVPGVVIGIAAGGGAGYYTGGWIGGIVGAIGGGVVGVVAAPLSAEVGAYIGGLAGSGAGWLAGTITFGSVSAAAGALGAILGNLLCGKPLGNDVGPSAAMGFVAPIISFEAVVVGGGLIAETSPAAIYYGINSGVAAMWAEIAKPQFWPEIPGSGAGLPSRGPIGDFPRPPRFPLSPVPARV